MCVPWYHRFRAKHVDEGATRCCISEQCSRHLCTLYGDLDLVDSYSLGKRDGICGMD